MRVLSLLLSVCRVLGVHPGAPGPGLCLCSGRAPSGPTCVCMLPGQRPYMGQNTPLRPPPAAALSWKEPACTQVPLDMDHSSISAKGQHGCTSSGCHPQRKGNREAVASLAEPSTPTPALHPQPPLGGRTPQESHWLCGGWIWPHLSHRARLRLILPGFPVGGAGTARLPCSESHRRPGPEGRPGCHAPGPAV